MQVSHRVRPRTGEKAQECLLTSLPKLFLMVSPSIFLLMYFARIVVMMGRGGRSTECVCRSMRRRAAQFSVFESSLEKGEERVRKAENSPSLFFNGSLDEAFWWLRFLSSTHEMAPSFLARSREQLAVGRRERVSGAARAEPLQSNA